MSRFCWLVLVAGVLAQGCMSVSQPRLASSLTGETFGVHSGAAADAAGKKVALLASPAEEPLTVDVDTGVGGTRVKTAQWLTDLAVALNKAIDKVSRFDERALPVTKLLFHSEMAAGDITYDWTTAKGPLPEINAQVAWLKVVKLVARSTSEGIEANLVVQVTMPGFAQGYACERTSPAHWERAVFACVGQKIIGDKRLWDSLNAPQ